MRKKSLQLLFTFILLLTMTQPVQALTILIENDGNISIHQGQILGDSDESDENEAAEKSEPIDNTEKELEKEKEHEAESAKKIEEEQREQAQRKAEEEKTNQEKRREQEKQKIEKERENLKKIKTIAPTEKKQLKVKVDPKKAEVLVTSKKPTDHNTFERQETATTHSLDIELPANQEDKSEDQLEIEQDGENESEAMKEVRTNRRERQDRLSIKTEAAENGEQAVTIESGNLKAKLKSAEFVIDPETNALTLTSANGQSHTLIHLPDMALQRMIDAGLINLNDQTATTELIVETKDDGEVVYKTKAKEVRRVFGLIPVEFENEIELDDASSETSSTPVDNSFFGQLLRRISR